MDKDVQGLEAGGFAEALPKPFSMEELTRAVRRVISEQ
jgi:DNA-binding response OmpR family regulator